MANYSVSFEALARFHVIVQAETPEEAGEAVENWGDGVAWGDVRVTDITGDCELIGEPERY